MKQRIQDEIRGIPPEMFYRAMGNLNGRLKECIRGGGRHLQDVFSDTDNFDYCLLTFWRRNYFFLILAHPVYKI